MPEFPDSQAFAQLFFQESTRHLEDARVLHAARRYAASITSSMKAGELGIKSVLVLDGAMGWWENLLKTHNPLTEIQNHLILKRHYAILENFEPNLAIRIKDMEKLAPSRAGAKGAVNAFNEAEQNTEYPYLYHGPDPATGRLITQGRIPSQEFGEVQSRNHFTTARKLLAALTTLYRDVSSWGFLSPPPL